LTLEAPLRLKVRRTHPPDRWKGEFERHECVRAGSSERKRKKRVHRSPSVEQEGLGAELIKGSIKTTGDVYVQPIEQSVLQAVNSRAPALLKGWKAPVIVMGQKGRNPKGSERGPEAIRRSWKRRRL